MLPLVKSTIFILLVTFSSTLSSMVVPPPPLPTTLPLGYFEYATLPNAAADYPLTFQNAFWTVQFDPQLDNCKHLINFTSWITVQGPATFEPKTLEIPVESWTGNYVLNSDKIRDLFDIDGLPGLFWASHIAFQLKIDNNLVGPALFPGESKTIKIDGLPEPCNCLWVTVDAKNHTILVYPGYCQ